MSDTLRPGHVELTWLGEQRYQAVNASGAETLLDGDQTAGLSPMESLLGSVAGCMGIDVVMILQKMRLDVAFLRIEMEGERVESPPRYFRRVCFRFRIGGKVPKEKAEHAVKLSLDRYCSVLHSLRTDLEVETSCIIDPDETRDEPT